MHFTVTLAGLKIIIGYRYIEDFVVQRYICTVAVTSYVADMSSDVTGYTEPIISGVLSNNTQHKTGN